MRLIGRIKWFDAQKGYGFIEREGEPDVFVHYSALQMEGFRTIEDGAEVEFEIVQGEKGPAASNVMKTSPGSPAKASEESSEADW